MTDVAPVLGVLAGLVGIAGTIPYVRDTVRGATRPHRGTWLIWSVLPVVLCLSQRADGASWSLITVGAVHVVLNGLILLFAIHRGEGGLSAPDAVMIAIAGGGVVGWIVAHQPIVAIACVIVADLLAAAMMVPKTYRDPGAETLVTFVGGCLGGGLAVGAVGAADLSLLSYPIYYCLANGALAILIHYRRGVLGSAPARASAHQVPTAASSVA